MSTEHLTRLVRNRDTVHRRECRYAVEGISTPWIWAQGRSGAEIEKAIADAGNASKGIKFCRTCQPTNDEVAR